jgi:hypothetical protein
MLHMTEPEHIEINSGHFTEAFERMHLLGEIIEVMSNHPVFLKYPKLNSRMNEVKELTYDLYQAVGNSENEWTEMNRYAERDE